NAQVIKQAILLLKKQPASAAGKNLNIEVITIGRKGDVAMHRLGVNVVASFTELSDHISLSEIIPISKLAIDEYSALKYDKVLVAYTDFISALTQRANIKQIIPVTKADLKELIEEKSAEVRLQQNQKINYLIEGDMNTLILSLAEKITRMQIYQMLLESNASEQSSRMVAMKNASDASGEMIDDLTLVFNKARQSNITREISEISAGMASVS
ncbi:MAG TPA: F0F1 ATP synthase subunit gamma, partial [Patescibacteria group bacterium]|nr:F0F1 ATP synthase subunit gamma [Patescibacteria group bacterium]